MTRDDIGERLASTLDDIDTLYKEKADYLADWKERMTVLHNDLRDFRADVRQMRLGEVEG